MLTLVPVPIGNSADFTLRGLEVLRQVSTVIVEETKESSAWLRSQGISGKKFENLNEHTTREELTSLMNLCRDQDVALITDCGTPGFCDPGADLIKLCRKNGVKVLALPGASSLMLILSLSCEKMDQFLFRGFLPAKSEERDHAWKELKKIKMPIVIMDTPYRLQKTISEVSLQMPNRYCLLGLNLTQENEQIIEALGAKLPTLCQTAKAEFMLILYSDGT